MYKQTLIFYLSLCRVVSVGTFMPSIGMIVRPPPLYKRSEFCSLLREPNAYIYRGVIRVELQTDSSLPDKMPVFFMFLRQPNTLSICFLPHGTHTPFRAWIFFFNGFLHHHPEGSRCTCAWWSVMIKREMLSNEIFLLPSADSRPSISSGNAGHWETSLSAQKGSQSCRCR